MEFPKYIIVNDYKMDKDIITFNITELEYSFYKKWFLKSFKNEGIKSFKCRDVFFGFKRDDKWNGFILSGVIVRNLSEYEVTIMYDYYNTADKDYINNILKYEIRKDKINNFL